MISILDREDVRKRHFSLEYGHKGIMFLPSREESIY